MIEQFTAREERTFVKSLLDQTGATPTIVDRLMDEYDERQERQPCPHDAPVFRGGHYTGSKR